MILGQFAKMLLLPLLPLFLKTIGMKATLLMGIAAWGVRYGVFGSRPSDVAGRRQPGAARICYDFFFVAAYIHVDNQASSEIRASARRCSIWWSWAGHVSGQQGVRRLNEHFTDATGRTDWTQFWAWPAVGVIVPVFIFAMFFKDRKAAADPGAQTSI